MPTIIINGSKVEVNGVSITKLSTERVNGGYNGVSAFIRDAIDQASKQGNGITIVSLEKAVVKHFTPSDEDIKAAKEKGLEPPKAFPSQQARVRINNLVKNSKDKYVKRWSPEGLVTVINLEEATKAIKKA